MWRLLVVPVAAVVLLMSLLLVFYEGRYVGQVEVPQTADIRLPSFVVAEFAEAVEQRWGTFLVDVAHGNDFEEPELGVLLARVADRGYKIDYLGERDHRWPLRPEERLAQLEEKLRFADVLAVALPVTPYSPAEVQLIKTFVNKGGRLLLVGDPTRRHAINSLATAFGILFEDDYLYNVVEHESNYQNIFLTVFRQHPITEDLKKVVFYAASSIEVTGGGLIFTDLNTFSSTVEGRGSFITLAETPTGVVAISDLTFMTEPYNSAWSNDQLVSNIADYLTLGQRSFHLSDFPHFFGQKVDVVAGQDSLLGSATEVRNLLLETGREAELQREEDFSQDTVFLDLFGSERVDHYLAEGHIRIKAEIETPFAPPLPIKNSYLLYLHQAPGRWVLILLGDSPETVRNAVAWLRSGDFRGDLVSDNAALYHLPGSPAG
ncbi:MAG TPA: hypothetical protein G4O03_07840 [Dehalococcoidia bacterium]|nr:hypothetical protein [Dehalococcoidia bacterium]